MEMRKLGIAECLVSSLCLGTMTFGNEADEKTSGTLIRRYLDAGGNFIDTAEGYSSGESEAIVGRALLGRRDEVVLATKGNVGIRGESRQESSQRLVSALEDSLTRLQTDHVDLYQVHWPYPDVPLEDTLETLDQLVRSGKVRFVGLSNYLGSQLMQAFLQCESNGWSPIVSHQPQYSLVCRDIENETLALCMERGCAVLPWSPLGGGVLTGKYVASEPVPVGTRLGDSEAQARRRLSEFNLSVASEVAKVAGELGKTSAQVALNWVLHRPGVTAPIIGARNLDQLEDNLGAEGWSLDADQLSALDAASSRPLPYPQNMYQMLGIRFAQ